ncbi:MAG: tetraacyldisaccharide 4'-kinase [bacterium]|nr:tetraacyldisaccharide 4'-kinase [bacterium]
MKLETRNLFEAQDGGNSPIHFFLLLLSRIYGGVVSLRSFLYDKGIFKTHRLEEECGKGHSEIRNPKSEIQSPQSAIRNPQSEIGNRNNPQSAKVISIGNITVGGTGKTPAVITITRELVKRGKRVVILSRGYKGSCEHSAGIVSDGERILLSPDESGDEPYLMARKLPAVPVIVGSDRIKTGRLAISNFGAQIIILDDGFSHRRIYRDLDVVLINSLNPFGNGYLLPRGILREGLLSLRRADYFILTQIADCGLRIADCGLRIAESSNQTNPKSKIGTIRNPKSEIQNRNNPQSAIRNPQLINILNRINPQAPILEAIHRPVDLLDLSGKSYDLEMINGRNILAISSIAVPEHFESTLSKLGAAEVSAISFPDHHAYQGSDIDRIISLFREKKAEAIITTEKDWVRLNGKIKPDEWPFFLMRIEFEITSDPDFKWLCSVM